MSDFLQTMAETSHLRARSARAAGGEDSLVGLVASAAPPLPLRLSPSGFDVIAEPKLASPSSGPLTRDGAGLETVLELAGQFTSAGASALSVLTEPTRFHGDLTHLRAVAGRVSVPVMRKDFLVDPIQVLEARANGASGILLIARLCSAGLLVEMTDLASSLGMFVLVELFDDQDIDLAEAVFDRDVLVGVNSRDLVTLEVDAVRLERMVSRLPDHLPLVAESGVVTVKDARRVASLGYDVALVGTGLVVSEEPGRLLEEMINEGRQAAAKVAP